MGAGEVRRRVRPAVKGDAPDLPAIVSPHYGGGAREPKKAGGLDWGKVDDLDEHIRKGSEPGESDSKRNISVHAVELLRILARKAIEARRAAVEAQGKPEYADRVKDSVAANRDLQELIREGGQPLEKAHRDYLKYVRDHRRFRRLREEARFLNRRLEAISGNVLLEVSGDGSRPVGDASVKAEVARRQKSRLHDPVSFDDVTPEELSLILPKGTDYGAAIEEFKRQEGDGQVGDMKSLLASTDQGLLASERERRLREAERMWRDPMVQYLEQMAQVGEYVQSLEAGNEVLELPYTVAMLNQLYDMEARNPHSTIGAVAVGDPGTGKTTAIRYYLSQGWGANKPRRFAYMDLSREVTRYQYLGSKDIESRSHFEDLQKVLDALEKLDEAGVAAVVRRGVGKYGAAFAAMSEEALEGEGKSDQRAKLKRVLDDRLADVLSDEIYKAGKRNGWRYGFLIFCLKNNICPIFDEFNKAQNLDPMFGLMTAQPATDEEAGPMPGTTDAELRSSPRGWFYFADNNEWMRVPANWRIYLTANVGSVHQVYGAPPAVRSRMEGKVVKFEFPPVPQEMMAAHSMLCDPDLEFRAPYGVAEGLRVLISEVFPKLRNLKGKDMPHPISLRTLDNICSSLYDRKREVSRANSIVDLEHAIIDTMLDVYHLDEKREAPQKTAELLTEVGLCLSPEVEDRMVGWLCNNPNDAAEREEKKKALAEKRTAFEAGEVLKRFRDTTRYSYQSVVQRGPPGVI